MAQSAQGSSIGSRRCNTNEINAGGAESNGTEAEVPRAPVFRRRLGPFFDTGRVEPSAGKQCRPPAVTGLLAITKESLRHPWKVGLAPAKPASRKRRRRSLVAERQARRRNCGITAALSRSERAPQTVVAIPLAVGPALIVILLLSLGLWATIWAALASALFLLG